MDDQEAPSSLSDVVGAPAQPSEPQDTPVKEMLMLPLYLDEETEAERGEMSRPTRTECSHSSAPQMHTAKPSSQVTVLGGGALGRGRGDEGGTWWDLVPW